MNFADNLNRHKILDKFEFDSWLMSNLVSERGGGDGTGGPIYIGHCPEHSLFIFYFTCMKVADNLDRHKILYEYKFRQDRIIHFGVLAFECQKKPIIDQCVLNFYPIFMKLVEK